MSQIYFDYPLGWQVGLPLVTALLAIYIVWLRRKERRYTRVIVLGLLRTIVMLSLVLFIARPVKVIREKPKAGKSSVVLLLDRSQSMSLQENGKSRYEQMLEFMKMQLLPILKKTGWQIQPYLFAEETEPSDGKMIVGRNPDGKKTNLGRAISRSMDAAGFSPIAVIALTDGIANENEDNTRALSALVEMKTPFIGIGIGSDQEVKTLSLRQVETPSTVPPNQEFKVSAQLEMIHGDEIGSFDLLLMRGGQFFQKKIIQPQKGSRFWMENFLVTEKDEGVLTYTVQIVPPQIPNLTSANLAASTSVRISKEKELRVLYVQGALTWDYKYITLALRKDPSIKLTGLTRTSNRSIFRQNVESSGELLNGFPTVLEEMAAFRVVVMSNLTPADLSIAQQELLAKFCGELGGGILMIGGAETFNASWQNSRLEQLLPVVFSSGSGVQGLDRPFQLQLTQEGLQHPVFQLREDRSNATTWQQLPTFQRYGHVDAAKNGAQVWAIHPTDQGPNGNRILMACQRYGAGLSSVVCVENIWRWRLAKNTDCALFDRFWSQYLRFMGDSGRQDISIFFPDQELSMRMEVHVMLEKHVDPKNVTDTNVHYIASVEDDQKRVLHQQSLDLTPSHPVDLSFTRKSGGIFTVFVRNPKGEIVASRSIEIKNVNVEFLKTGRSMEILNQWAALSNGLAIKIEDCSDPTKLLEEIKVKVEQAERAMAQRIPLGIHMPILLILLGLLACEWILKKQWQMG